jgi:hypothetical protein
MPDEGRKQNEKNCTGTPGRNPERRIFARRVGQIIMKRQPEAGAGTGGPAGRAEAEAVLPRFGKPESGSFQGLEYSFRRRIGAPGLAYQFEQSGSLVSNVWNEVTGSPAVSGVDMYFEEVVYSLSTDAPQQFFRLQIQDVQE